MRACVIAPGYWGHSTVALPLERLCMPRYFGFLSIEPSLGQHSDVCHACMHFRYIKGFRVEKEKNRINVPLCTLYPAIACIPENSRQWGGFFNHNMEYHSLHLLAFRCLAVDAGMVASANIRLC